MTETPDTTTAPAVDLDLAIVGEFLFRLPIVAASLRHASVQSSLDYIHPLSGGRGHLELEFVRDMLTEPLDVIHDKWYGGRFRASAAGASIMDEVLKHLQALAAKR